MLLALLLLACPTSQQTVGCADHSPDECASYEGCVAIDANEMTVSDDGTCYELGASEAVGCMADDIGCDDAIAWAGPGDGTCFELGDRCVPDGWEMCDPPADAVCEG